jgi:two-component system phosphate regulon sensor histidine kinase PhoR
MTARIFFKLLLSFVGLLLVAALGADYLATRVARRDLRRELERGLAEKARLAERMLAGLPPRELSAAVDEIADRAGTRVTVILRDGTVVADSEADPREMENHAGRPEFVQAFSEGIGVDSRSSRTLGREFLYLAIPLSGPPSGPLSGPGREGALRLALAVPEIDARTADIHSNIIEMALLACIPAIFLAGWLARRVSRDLSGVMRFSSELAKGNFDAEPPRVSQPELAILGESLATAAQRLRSMFERTQQERSRFEAVLNSTVEGILVVDSDRHTMLSNPALRRMFPEENLQPGSKLAHWSCPEIPKLFDEVFERGEWQASDLVVREPRERAWKISCAPIKSVSGDVRAAVAVFQDITELEMAGRMRKDFVINVSHELRTPLASIQGYAETLLDGAIDDREHSRRFLEIIRASAVRLGRLTADLMTLSQMEMHAREFHFASHRADRLLGQAADGMRALIEQEKIQFVVEEAGPELQLDCDEGAIEQVLMNLLENAAKYTPAGGMIRLRAEPRGAFVRFSVRDTGMGIAAEHIPRLFERFYRVDKARSRALGGTGLGLAIVKHIVLAHLGSVEVESVTGEGSVFSFLLPVRAPMRAGES